MRTTKKGFPKLDALQENINFNKTKS